jgi:hypothetical protein
VTALDRFRRTRPRQILGGDYDTVTIFKGRSVGPTTGIVADRLKDALEPYPVRGVCSINRSRIRMSYSINDGITELEDTLATYRQIIERFPDAYLDQQRIWVTKELKPEQCDHFQVGPNDVVRVGTLVGGHMVALPIVATGARTMAAFLRNLKDESPDQFRALALFAAGANKA